MRAVLQSQLGRALSALALFSFVGCSKILSPSGGNTLSGVVQLARVSGATISVFEMLSDGNKGSLLASTTTDSNGEYTVSLGTYSGSVIVESNGGTYNDEATGTTKTATTLSAIAGSSTASNAPITPMSHLVKERTIALLATSTLTLSEAKAQAVSEVAGLFGVSAEDLSVTPTSATALSSLNTRATRAALGLAAFSYLLKDFRHAESEVSVEDALSALAEDLKDDGRINGSTSSTIAKKLAMEWKASMASAKTAAAANSNLVFSKLASDILAEVSSTTLDTGSELNGLQEDGSFYINGVNTGLEGGTGLFIEKYYYLGGLAHGIIDQNFYDNGSVIGRYDANPQENGAGTVTFTSSPSASFNYTNNEVGFVFSDGTLLPPGASLTTSNGVTFNYGSANFGTVTGNPTFNDNSSNDGTVTGDPTFNYGSVTAGTVTGNPTFNDYSYNDGTVTGDPTFNDYSYNFAGTVTGNPRFNDYSYNLYGTVTGTPIYNGLTGYTSDWWGEGYFILGQLTTLDASGNGVWNDHVYSSGDFFTGLGNGTLGVQNKYYSSGTLLTGTAANGSCYINGEERGYPDSFIFGDYGSTPVTDTNLNTLSNYWLPFTSNYAPCFPDSNDAVTITTPVSSGTLNAQTIYLQSNFSGGTLNGSVTIGKGGEAGVIMSGGTINGDVTFGVTGWASPSYPIFESGTINGNVTFESGSIMVGGTITGNTTWNGFTGQYSKPGASYDGKYFAGGHLRQPEDGPLNGSYYINGEVVGACSGDCFLEGSSPNYAQGLAIGSLRSGPDNTTLTLQYANGTDGFKVWREKDGNRILNATGLVANGWQKMLTRAGTAFSSATDNTQYFTSGSNIAGRVCPSEVFIDRAHPLESNRCLYFTTRNSQIALNASSTGGIYGEDYLEDPRDSSSGNGNNVSWYEGNIKACADKGMRLPVLYEVSNIDPGSSYRPTDWNPSFSSSEVVPSSVLFDENIEAGRCSWSATGTTIENNAGYISAGGANVDCPWPMWYDEQEYNNALVCVLPSH